MIGLANRHINVYNPANPRQQLCNPIDPLLKYQSRCIALFPDETGFAIGSIEGRVAIHHFETHHYSKNFAFKCHRNKSNIYAVNSISFNRQHGTFSTAGSDGTFNFWDKNNKQRLKQFNQLYLPITATCFNSDGTIFAYAISYDWSKGLAGKPANAQPQIFLHSVKPKEITPRK